jgi:hypothetical protein
MGRLPSPHEASQEYIWSLLIANFETLLWGVTRKVAIAHAVPDWSRKAILLFLVATISASHGDNRARLWSIGIFGLCVAVAVSQYRVRSKSEPQQRMD